MAYGVDGVSSSAGAGFGLTHEPTAREHSADIARTPGLEETLRDARAFLAENPSASAVLNDELARSGRYDVMHALAQDGDATLQLAQARSGRGTAGFGWVSGGMSPGQAARYEVLRAQNQSLLRDIQRIDPSYREGPAVSNRFPTAEQAIQGQQTRQSSLQRDLDRVRAENAFPPSPGIGHNRPPPEPPGSLIDPLPGFPNLRPLNPPLGVEPTAPFGVLGVRPGQVMSYDEFQALSLPRDGLTGDHIPSRAAMVERVEAELGEPLTRAEADWVRQNTTIVVITEHGHREYSLTYGGRNTPDQIQSDSQSLRATASRDFAAIARDLREQGLSEPQITAVREALHAANARNVERLNERFDINIRY